MIKSVRISDIGRVRSVNEDSVWVGYTENGYMLGIVADGMGGHQAGDIASRLAIETITQDLLPLERGISQEGIRAALGDAILHANDVIYRTASSNEQYHSMGTTVVALLLQGTEGYIGHIGDSRAYKVSNGQVVQLTEDHTLVNELYKNGQLSLDELESHPRRNVLTRALGTDPEVQVDFDPVTLKPNELIMLCSDGLSNMVSVQHIAQVGAMHDVPLEERADRLLQLALLAGGDDNISIALFELQDEVAGTSTKEWGS